MSTKKKTRETRHHSARKTHKYQRICQEQGRRWGQNSDSEVVQNQLKEDISPRDKERVSPVPSDQLSDSDKEQPEATKFRQSKETQDYEKFCRERSREIGEDEHSRSTKSIRIRRVPTNKQRSSHHRYDQLGCSKQPKANKPGKKTSVISSRQKASAFKNAGYEYFAPQCSIKGKRVRGLSPLSPSAARIRHESEKSEDKVHGLGFAYHRRASLDDVNTFSARSARSLPAKSPATMALTKKAGKLHPRVEKYTLEKPIDPLLKYYIGHSDKTEAEKSCLHRGSFRLYHRCPSQILNSYDGLLGGIPLIMVYYGSDGVYRHWPILNRSRPSKKKQVYVEISFTEPIYFDTLAGLVYFYANCVSLYKDNDQKIRDRFPIWLDCADDEITVRWKASSNSEE